MEELSNDYEEIGDEVNADYSNNICGDAWDYNPNSELLKVAQDVYKSKFNKKLN